MLTMLTTSYTGYTHLGDKVDTGFKWPDALCAAMNSVRAEYFGTNALPSRLHAVNAAQLKERVTKYLQDIGDYFLLLSGRNTNQRQGQVLVQVLSNEKLEEIIRRLVGYSGEQLSHTGNVTNVSIIPEEKYTLLSFKKGAPYNHSIHSNYSNFIDGTFINNFYTYSIISYNHMYMTSPYYSTC